MIDPKPRPNHRIYIEVLREMTPEQRLAKAFELSALGKELFCMDYEKGIQIFRKKK